MARSRVEREKSWTAVLRRTVREFREDNLTDWAAALTYYGIQAIFPGLLALVSILGLFGSSATGPLLENLNRVAPGPAREILTNALHNLESNRGAAGVLLAVGILGALWSASGYIGAFMRASNAIYDIEEGRPWWKTMPLRLVITVVLVVMLVIVAVGVTFTGGLAAEAGRLLGVGGTAVGIWDVAKWPVMLAVVVAMFAILYWAAPNVRHPRPPIRWVSPGAVVGLLLWAAASAGFALYVANFGSYNKTYGALGGIIIFLVWIWISNVAILLGAEFNAEMERGHQIKAGQPVDREPFLEPREASTSGSAPAGGR